MSQPFDPNQPGQNPQQGYPQQPYGAPPMTAQQAKANAKGAKAQAKAMRPLYKKKRFWFGAILALIVLISIINSVGGSDEDPTSAVPADTNTKAAAPGTTKAPATEKPETKDPAKPEETKAEEPTSAKVGDKVTAGDWDFTVTKIKCGIKSVGSDYLNKKAQGQFCVLNLSVKNNGNKAETLNGDNQKLLDDKGREFSSDYEASTYADPDSNIFLEEINPGNTMKGQVVFDIPKDVEPAQATLAGGLFGIKDVATVDLS